MDCAPNNTKAADKFCRDYNELCLSRVHLSKHTGLISGPIQGAITTLEIG